MNEKAFGAAIENVIDALDPHSDKLPDVDIPIIQQARIELANARKLLEAAEDLLAAHHHSRSDDYVHDVRVLVAACRASAGKNQNA